MIYASGSRFYFGVICAKMGKNIIAISDDFQHLANIEHIQIPKRN